jgi:hypothetical protein
MKRNSILFFLDQRMAAFRRRCLALISLLWGVFFSCSAPIFAAPNISLIARFEQPWRASDVWTPLSQNILVTQPKALIGLGCWWDGLYRYPTPDLPTDSGGKFLNAIAETLPVGTPGAPAQVQMVYETNAVVGMHIITPPAIGGSGDGFYLALEVEGLAMSPVRASGRSRISHPFYGLGDPNTIQAISVQTQAAAAQIGDLAVAIFIMDPDYNTDIRTQLPAGWTLLGRNDLALDNVGYLACYKIVTTPGVQAVTFNWTDTSTFVAEAGIAVFAAAEPAGPETNVPPVLTGIGNRTIDEQMTLSVNIGASDANSPAQSLTYALTSSPPGASINSSGVLTWTPTEAQGPSTNEFTVVVTDNGTPKLSAAQSFQVVVNEVNTSPVLSLPADQTISEMSPLNVSASATDSDGPTNRLTYALVEPPVGMTINAETGAISWTPSEAQGPNSYTITVTVEDNSPAAINEQHLRVANNFKVQVNEVNTAPIASLPGSATLHAGITYSNNAVATDIDIPANTLGFSLVSGPDGLTVSSGGQIVWSTGTATPGEYPIRIRLADDGAPSLSSTQFLVLTIVTAPILSIQSDSLTNTLTWTSVPDGLYRIEYKNEVNVETWTEIPEEINPVGSVASKAIGSSSGLTNRFYRIRVLR